MEEQAGQTNDSCVAFPALTCLAASWNPQMSRIYGEALGEEALYRGKDMILGPGVNIYRTPLNGRNFEYMGEDPFLASIMVVPYIQGLQSKGVSACVKHYCLNNDEEYRHQVNVIVSDRALHEIYLPAFKAAVEKGKTWGIMGAYNLYKNEHNCHNQWTLNKILKGDWKYDGVVVSDWGGAHDLEQSVKNGLDMEFGTWTDGLTMGATNAYDNYYLSMPYMKAIQEGKFTQKELDDKVRRVLRLKYRLNLFEKPYYDLKDFPLFGSAEHAAAALQAAEESLVLLKNTDGILPLAKGKKLLVTGPNANSMRCLNGGWSYSWQGDKADEHAGQYNTILEAFTNKFGADNIIYEAGVTYKQGGNWWEENAPEIEKAVAAAAGADYIVACIGENSYCETPGNLTNLFLSQNQLDLVKALAKTGKPVILVLNEGRPRLIADIEPLAKAVVNTMLPGNYGGDALANLIAGDANFSGKMPFTYPKEINSLITYDYKPCEHIGKQMEGAYNYDAQVSVQWAFGYGLSYTTFAYSNLKVDKSDFTADDVLTFTVDVKNTGNRIGKESVLLFSSDLVASLTPDTRRLRAFEKVELKPGETKTVTLKLKGSDLAFVGYDGKWILEKGDFRIQTGDQTVNVVCTDTKKWETPNK